MIPQDLRDKLCRKFSRELWRDLFPQLFPGTAFFQAPQDIPSNGEVAKTVKQIGFLPLADDSRLGIFEVEIANEHTVIARNRVGLRSLVAKLVDQATIHGALVLFYRPGSPEYRLSFISKHTGFTDEGRLHTTETAPKRYTYVLGENEPCTTATQRLGELLERKEKLTLNAVTEVFSVARVTKDFYKAVENHHSALLEHLKKFKHIKGFEEPRVCAQFATRLLGRLVFLKFLAKKGIVPEAFFNPENKRDITFYQKTLGALFFQTLNKPKEERPDDLPAEFAKIPYLNGGLFEPHDPYDGWPNLSVNIPPVWFKELFETFQAYNFTVDENSIQDVEIAVDPEMLGQIFENLLATVRTETGQVARDAHGAFYTPREVVDYLCRQALRVRLRNLLPSLEDKHLDAMFSSDTSVQLPELPLEKSELLNALDSLKVFDPAVGSGAFPIGILHVMAELYEKLDDRFDAYKVKKRIIKNNLYGADIEPMAIELAKLRCWLSLMVESDKAKVEALPNLDLKFFCLNTLIDLPPLKEDDVLFWRTGVQELLVLESGFFECRAKEKAARRLAIGKKLDELYQGVRNQYVHKAISRGVDTKKRKKAIDTASLYPESPTLFQDWLNNGTEALPFFPKELLCPDVFPLQSMVGGTLLGNFLLVNEVKGQQELTSKKVSTRNGFDVVVANPPYVRQEDIKELKPRLEDKYDCYKGTADLYVYFYERSVQLLADKGSLAFISSNKFYRSGYGDKLRGYLSDKHTIHQLIDFGDADVFKAIAYPTIVVLSKGKSESKGVKAMSWEPGPPVEEFSSIFDKRAFYISQNQFTEEGWRIERPEVLALLRRLKERGTPLRDYINGRFYRGILTGLNEAFVVDQETKEKLVKEHSSSLNVLKPFLRGRDVKRWTASSQNLWLIYIPWHFPLHEDGSIQGASIKAEQAFKKNYPAIYRHLSQYKEGLSNRNEAETGVRYEWYSLQRWGSEFWREFERPKILYQEIATFQAFAWENGVHYCNNKVFIIPDAKKELLGFLNSSLAWWWLGLITTKLQGGAYQMQSPYMEQLSIIEPSQSGHSDSLNKIVSLLITNQHPILEAILNALVFELYFPKELHAENLNIFKLLEKVSMPDADDKRAVAAFTQALADPNHALRRALFTLGSLPTVRLIEGRV